MKILNRENGCCEFVFSDEEIKVISKNKKLILPPAAFKHVINSMGKTFMNWITTLGEKDKEIASSDKIAVKTK